MITKSKIYIVFIGLMGLINLFFLYYIKYSFNQLTFSNFEIVKTGNLISLILTLLLFVGCLFLLFKKKLNNIRHYKFIFAISIFYLSLLIFLVLFSYNKLEFFDNYLFGYHFKKIIPIIILVLNQILFLFVLFVLWYFYFGYNILAYFYSSLTVLLTIALLIIVSFLLSYLTNEYYYNNDIRKYDYGIVMGAAVWSGNRPSPIFTRRIEKGAELFLNKKIEKIQLTGGNAPGELSEAQTAYNYIQQKFNIDSTHILIEEVTATTNEQIRYIRNKFSDNYKQKRFLFISDSFHLKRISEMADFYYLNATTVASGYEINFQKSLYYRFRDSIGLILFWFFAI